jgi:putative DNA methylase
MPEGWLAILRALTASGFVVSAAHPIKAEMSVGNPKAAAKEPINLDAILVCRKRGGVEAAPQDDVGQAVNDESTRLRVRFKRIGRKLSRGDRFVIAASQVLHHASIAGVPEDRVRGLLEDAHTQSHGEEPIDEMPPPPAEREAK